jgi:hypothetical protein
MEVLNSCSFDQINIELEQDEAAVEKSKMKGKSKAKNESSHVKHQLPAHATTVEYPRTVNLGAHQEVYESQGQAITALYEYKLGELSNYCTYDPVKRIIYAHSLESSVPNPADLRKKGLELLWLPMNNSMGDFGTAPPDLPGKANPSTYTIRNAPANSKGKERERELSVHEEYSTGLEFESIFESVFAEIERYGELRDSSADSGIDLTLESTYQFGDLGMTYPMAGSDDWWSDYFSQGSARMDSTTDVTAGPSCTGLGRDLRQMCNSGSSLSFEHLLAHNKESYKQDVHTKEIDDKDYMGFPLVPPITPSSSLQLAPASPEREIDDRSFEDDYFLESDTKTIWEFEGTEEGEIESPSHFKTWFELGREYMAKRSAQGRREPTETDTDAETEDEGEAQRTTFANENKQHPGKYISPWGAKSDEIFIEHIEDTKSDDVVQYLVQQPASRNMLTGMSPMLYRITDSFDWPHEPVDNDPETSQEQPQVEGQQDESGPPSPWSYTSYLEAEFERACLYQKWFPEVEDELKYLGNIFEASGTTKAKFERQAPSALERPSLYGLIDKETQSVISLTNGFRFTNYSNHLPEVGDNESRMCSAASSSRLREAKDTSGIASSKPQEKPAQLRKSLQLTALFDNEMTEIYREKFLLWFLKEPACIPTEINEVPANSEEFELFYFLKGLDPAGTSSVDATSSDIELVQFLEDLRKPLRNQSPGPVVKSKHGEPASVADATTEDVELSQILENLSMPLEGNSLQLELKTGERVSLAVGDVEQFEPVEKVQRPLGEITAEDLNLRVVGKAARNSPLAKPSKVGALVDIFQARGLMPLSMRQPFPRVPSPMPTLHVKTPPRSCYPPSNISLSAICTSPLVSSPLKQFSGSSFARATFLTSNADTEASSAFGEHLTKVEQYRDENEETEERDSQTYG